MSLTPAFSGYPQNLAFIAKRLAMFSRKTIKFQPLNLTSGVSTTSSGSPISVMLPRPGILDLDTFTMYFNGSTSCTSTATGTQTAGGCCFPKNIESIVRNLTTSVADKQLESVQEYNRLINATLDHTSGIDSDYKR